MSDIDIMSQEWRLTGIDIFSIAALAVIIAIPIVGWWFGAMYSFKSLAEAMKRRRALIWIASLLASLPVTLEVTHMAKAVFDLRGDDTAFFLVLSAAPIAHLVVSATTIAVEMYRNKVRRARRAAMETTQ